MKILFLAPYPQDEAPSQRFRFEQYFDVIKNAGFRYKLMPFWSNTAWGILYQPGKKIEKLYFLIIGFLKRWFQILFLSHSYNYIFIHREAAPIGPPVFEWILIKVFRKKVIYDFDDAIWLPNTSAGNKAAASLKWHNKVGKICKWSWKVSCGNEYLANYAKKWNKNVVLNPTTIETSYHKPQKKEENKKVVIGWTGTHSTLKYLDFLDPILKELQNQVDIEFLVIADQRPELKFDFTFVKWTKENEISDLSKIDIGVMPLTDDVWSQGKCGFKALQYMALGIPTIASPVGVNSKIIDNRINGYLCTNVDDWLKFILELSSDSEKRQKFGNSSRHKVENHYSVKSNTKTFIELFSE